MPFSDCPFSKFTVNSPPQPILPIQIINPDNGKIVSTRGLIDTGADECAAPASLASILGHDLIKGASQSIITGNGQTQAFAHTTSFNILHPVSFDILHTTKTTPINFLPNLHVVLLGVKSFLSEFVLFVDYPKQQFSIKRP